MYWHSRRLADLIVLIATGVGSPALATQLHMALFDRQGTELLLVRLSGSLILSGGHPVWRI